MPDTPSIVINKVFTYRGAPEEWSNKYHFSGTMPANLADAKALAIAIWNAERTFLCNDVKFNGFLLYAAGDKTANFIMGPDDLTTAEKTAGSSTNQSGPGDMAVWVRWATPDRNEKGRPIFLRKYFHGVAGTTGDTVYVVSRTAMIAYAAKMTDGTLPGSVRVCGPQGAVAGLAKVPTYTTTRTLKRRGADPS